jgi:hypothetical protein
VYLVYVYENRTMKWIEKGEAGCGRMMEGMNLTKLY